MTGRRADGCRGRNYPGLVAEYIYTLRRARKAHGDKVILDDVTLSFLPGAKIGVVGPNGAGKSTLLKIMAGMEDRVQRRCDAVAWLHGGDPGTGAALDESKNVLENVENGVAATKALMARFNEISEALADPEADYDTLLAEMGKLQEELDHRNAWDLDAQLEQAMDALRCPPPDADVSVLSGGERRRVALCKLLLQKARPAAARRADQPPRRRERAVARAAPGEVPRHGGRDHPRPVLPGQRGPVDPRTRPRPRLPLRGQLLHLPGDQGVPAEGRGGQGCETAQAPDRRTGLGAFQPQGAAGEEQVPTGRATRRWPPRPSAPASSTSRRSRSRRVRAWATS